MIKKLLNKNNEIVVKLNDKNRKQFLKIAKKEGFVWFDGTQIDANQLCCYHIVVNKNKTIGNLCTMAYLKSTYYQSLSALTY